jgi:hypothetical protein
MNAGQREPAVAICKRDDEILRALRDVRSNALPADRAVLATKGVVISRRREASVVGDGGEILRSLREMSRRCLGFESPTRNAEALAERTGS